MAQNDPTHWLEVAAKDPVLRTFVGFGMFISILLFVNDLRKRLFGDKLMSPKDESATQQLRAILTDYKDYNKSLRERIDDLEEENTDLRLELRKTKTQSIPPMERGDANEEA